MALIKTPQDLKHLRVAGKILARILDTVGREVRPGVKTRELDILAERLIREQGCVPSFKDYRDGDDDNPFPSTLCTSVNNEVVHVPASDRVLKEGDIVGVDIGLKYPADGREYFTDMAKTYAVGQISSAAKKLLDVTRQALDLGIAQMQVGKTVTDIGRAIQTYVESNGFSVVRTLVGHGVGHAVHEEPRVPNFVSRDFPSVPLRVGMVLAIEPMVNIGGYKIKLGSDGWSIITSDGSLSAHFEHTVAVTEKGPEILTI